MSRPAVSAHTEFGEDSTEQNIRKFPLAVGPCKVYRRPDVPKTGRSTLLDLGCCGVCNHLNCQPQEKWRNCHLTLFSDSTLSLHDGPDSSAPILASFKMEDLFKCLAFGDDICDVPGRTDIPEIPSTSWENVLAVPDEPHCNSTINWLDFSSQHTLNMWLVAICSSLPPEALIVRNESKHVREKEKTSREKEKNSQEKVKNSALKAHIRLFFSEHPSKAGLKRYGRSTNNVSDKHPTSSSFT